jgi:hypothetical protein
MIDDIEEATRTLMRHQMRDAAWHMYKAIDRSGKATDPKEVQAAILEAAGYAEMFLDGITWWPKDCGHWTITIGAMQVPLKRIEETAYSALARRASTTTTNPFEDTGARWFR